MRDKLVKHLEKASINVVEKKASFAFWGEREILGMIRRKVL